MNKNEICNIKPSWYIMFLSFFYIGLVTIGGGLAMLPIMEDEFVNKRKFLTKDEIIDVFTLAQSIPGVIAINTSLLTGFILIIAPIFEIFQNLEYVNKAFLGIRGSIAALIFLSAFGMGKQIMKDKFTTILFILFFILIVFFNFNTIYALILSALIGLLYYLLNTYIKNKK